MSPGKSVSAARTFHLAALRRELSAGDEGALRATCSALGVPPEQASRFTRQAELVLQRAGAQLPAATSTEVELALGVLSTLFAATPKTEEVSG